MEFSMTLKFDIDKVKGHDLDFQSNTYKAFFEDAVRIIAQELRSNGIHPEVLEQSILKVRLTPEKVHDILYAK